VTQEIGIPGWRQLQAANRLGEHLLVVDDDPGIRLMLARYFEEEGYRVSTVADGRAMHGVFRAGKVDLVLLDVVLKGGQNGIELAREIRSGSDVPIIMLTDRADVTDRVVGLEMGADDYVPKPFHLREVLARVRSILRRRQSVQTAVSQAHEHPVRFDGWALDFGRRDLTTPDGREIALTTGEFDMLAALVRNAGRVMSRDALMDLTRGRERNPFDRSIDAQIARLRRKIEPLPSAPRFIKSVRGVGYVFVGKVDRTQA
jgi:two-component system phosphate regulon response regulator OmpR